MSNRFINATITLRDQMSGTLTSVADKMERTAKTSNKLGRQMYNTGRKLEGVGKGLTTKLTAPILAVGAAAVTMNSQFEDAMAKVGTIADTTSVSMKTLEDQVLSLSNQTGASFSDIAEAQYQAISAGVDTASSAEFVGVAVKAAKGGFTDTATAVDGLTTVLNAYGLKASEASEISDQMMVTQKLGKTTFGELASSMGKVIPTASAMSVSTKELFSSMAVLTKNGIKTAEATTGLKAAYSNILKPSSSAAEYAKKIGLNFSASHLKSVGWAKFLDEIKDKTGGDAEKMGKLFGSTKALNSMLVLTGKGSKDFSTALGMMDNSAGATTKAYKKMLTPAEKNRIALNKLKNSAIKIGAALSPVITKISGLIGKVADKISGLSDKQMDMVMKVAAVLAVLGPVLIVAGKALKIAGDLKQGTGGLAVGIKLVGKAMGAMNLKALLIIVAIAGIVTITLLIIKHWKTVVKWAKIVGKTVMTIFKGIGDFFAGLWEGIKAGFKAFINFIIKGINMIPEGINSISIKIPDWVPKVGGNTLGFNIPTIPYLAKGTNNWKGGLTHINERGGEIVDLPRGTRVYPHDKSVQMAKAQGKSNVVVNVSMNGLTIREEADVQKLANAVGEEIYKRLDNMGVA